MLLLLKVKQLSHLLKISRLQILPSISQAEIIEYAKNRDRTWDENKPWTKIAKEGSQRKNNNVIQADGSVRIQIYIGI